MEKAIPFSVPVDTEHGRVRRLVNVLRRRVADVLQRLAAIRKASPSSSRTGRQQKAHKQNIPVNYITIVIEISNYSTSAMFTTSGIKCGHCAVIKWTVR
jgi:hypothetical protein